jgi:energy-coupling factor transporter ATP-binding protein EcfA2
VDFHAHTPASVDYGQGSQQQLLKQRTPKEWLLDHMRAGIDCVAITDHNSGAWIDRLYEALGELEREKPRGYRPIFLFPGVEISVYGGVHLLAILPRGKSRSDVDSLLGAVGFAGTKGSSDDVTSKTFREVVDEILLCDGIAIPAHVDGNKGLFSLTGTTLEQALSCNGIVAIEVLDPANPKPNAYSQKKIGWTEVLGSDSHHPSDNNDRSSSTGTVVLSEEQGSAAHRPSDGKGQHSTGCHFTWLKMGEPTIEGLRLALLDGALSVRRSDVITASEGYPSRIGADALPNPNLHAPLVLESIEVSDARYMGRATSFKVRLNPWLNAIVGGRGTGKSSLIEFLRLALRRDEELPEELKPEFEKYARSYENREDGGLLTDKATVRVIYRKHGSRFRIQWSPSGDLDAIEEDGHGTWRRAEGDVIQRFPIRMYSQKQIFHLAKTPMALLKVVDEAPEVDRRSWINRWREEESRFLSLRAKAREIETGLSEEPRLRGELDDVKRKLGVFEEAGHADVLKSFQKRRRQERAVETWEESWADAGSRLRQIARELVPDSLDEGVLDKQSEEDAILCRHAAVAREHLDVVRESLEKLAGQADGVLSEWRAARDGSEWNKAVDTAVQAYESLRDRLAEKGAGDPSAYGELVQRRQTIEQHLKEMADRKTQVERLRQQAQTSSENLLGIRRELSASRGSFLRRVLKDNKYVRIKVKPYGARETVEAEFRRVIQRDERVFEKDIGSPDTGGFLGAIYAEGSGSGDIENALAKVKQQLQEIAAGSHDSTIIGDQRFAKHMARLQPEALDRLDLWYPEDSLDVEYSPTGDGQNLRSLEEGSPGQRTAALLAFLLSYGEEPLVLDQPEDDLDNHLIYELIVTQLREVKRNRQIVVVTHNPNIVVNGDAELVLALTARTGETHRESEGSLQEKQVRDTICTVMEGGRPAFEERYRRIALEGRHV